ncbi:MAG: hypothetical protein RBU29_05710 [bacterium]|jgi:hypothetical protein|nr:hypothetical protein [bacterium]
MSNLIQLPLAKTLTRSGSSSNHNVETQGDAWVYREKKLLDKAEFLEAMILVLDDVRVQNIRNRDYAMMEIVAEEIPLYEARLQDVQKELMQLRREYHASSRVSLERNSL